MLLVNWWKVVVLQRYAQFVGRAGRAEFWWFFLASFIISAVLNLLGQASNVLYVLGFIYSLAVLVPTIAVGVRRLHDTGRTGWWMLIGLVPLVGLIVLIVLWATSYGCRSGSRTATTVRPGTESIVICPW
jgi:uncharacterized membrane protein YhaH (DUF805 family)